MNQLIIRDGDIPLHAAIKRNDLEEVTSLLNQGANIAEQNKYGQNAFHIAALRGNTKILELLLNTNLIAEVVHAKDESGNTPFHFACREADEQSAALFLNTVGAYVDVQNRLGYTALHLASKDNKFNMVNFLLSKDADINALDNDKNTPLNLAIQTGSLEFIMNFLNIPNILLNSENTEKHTPLSLATQLCSLDLIKHLMAKGASFGMEKPLYCAAEKGWEEGMKFLFALHEYGQQPSYARFYALEFAIEKDLPALAKLFFALNDHFYTYAFDHALECNNLNAIKYILSERQELINSYYISKRISDKPLFKAVRYCDYKVVELFLEQGADVNVRDEDSNTLLHHAAKNIKHGFELINFLLLLRFGFLHVILYPRVRLQI